MDLNEVKISNLPPVLSPHQASLESLSIRSHSSAMAILKEIPDLEANGNFSPQTVERYFQRNLLRVSTLAQVPDLLEKVIEPSLKAIASNESSPEDKKSAANVIGFIVSEHFASVPMDYRLELISKVPDGDTLGIVAGHFLRHENFYFPIPKNSSVTKHQGDWQANIADIPCPDFERIMRARPDALAMLLAATHTGARNLEQHGITSEQMQVLCKITGNRDFRMCSTIPRGSHSYSYESTDQLQTGPFACAAFGTKEKIPIRFKRDLAILASNLKLPANDCCQLLTSHYEEHGPAAVLALWLSMRPDNAFNKTTQTVAHHFISKLANSAHSEQLAELCKISPDPQEFERILRKTILSGSDSEQSMKYLHTLINPSAADQRFSQALADIAARQERAAREVIDNALAVEEPQKFQASISEEVAKTLLASTSISDLYSKLWEQRHAGSITAESFPAVALESLSLLFERKCIGITQALAITIDKNTYVKLPKEFGFPPIEELARFLVNTGNEESVKDDSKFKAAYLQLALTTTSRQLEHSSKCWPEHVLNSIELLNMSELVQNTAIGQRLVGTLAGHVMINGDLKQARGFLVHRSKDPMLSRQVQEGFAESIPSILSAEKSGAGYGRIRSQTQYNLQTYQDLGLDISYEERRRAVVRVLKYQMHSNFNLSEEGTAQLKSFAERFQITGETLLTEIDRRAQKIDLYPNSFDNLLSFTRQLGLEISPKEKLSITRKPAFTAHAKDRIETRLSNASKALQVTEPLPDDWQSLSAKERVKLLCPDLSEVIDYCKVSDQDIQAAVTKAYKRAAHSGITIEHASQRDSDTPSDTSKDRTRMSELVRLFDIPKKTSDQIDREITLAKLPRLDPFTYAFALSDLINPIYPESLEGTSSFDTFRQTLLEKTRNTLSDIDTCVNYDYPKVSLNNRSETLAAIGTIATLVTNQILNLPHSDQINFIEKEIKPRALQGLGLSDEHLAEAINAALVMCTRAITNEIEPVLHGHQEEFDKIRDIIHELESKYTTGSSYSQSVEELHEEINRHL